MFENILKQYSAEKLFKSAVTLSLGGALAVSAVMMSTSFLSFGEYQEILRLPAEKEEIAEGVFREEYKIFTEDGWIVANVLRASIDNASLDVMYPQNLNKAETLSEMLGHYTDVIGAVNGDFFDYDSSAPLGRVVDDGRIVQTSIKDKKFSHLNISEDKKISLSYEPLNVFVKIGSKEYLVNYFNKPYTPSNVIILYDKFYGKASPAKSVIGDNVKNVTELLVEDGVVTEIRKNGGELSIPDEYFGDNSFIVHAQGKYAKKLADRVKVGDPVILDTEIQLRNIYESISGGTQLVKDGEQCDFSQNILGEHPRTAVGVEEDGKTVMLVTINGRTGSYRGIRQTEFADFLVSIGADQAMILDGGGSTEMIANNPFGSGREIVSHLSDGKERKIYSAIGFGKSDVNTDVLREIRLKEKNINTVVGCPILLEVQAVDSAFRKMDIDNEGIECEAMGLNGYIEKKQGGVYFVPTGVSDGSIKVSYQGKTDYINISVKENPVDLTVRKEGNKYLFELLLEDGFKVAIPSDMLDVYVSNNFVWFNKKTSELESDLEKAVGYVTFTYYLEDNKILSKSVPFTLGNEENVIEDFEAYSQPEKPDDYSVLIHKNPAGDGMSALYSYGFKDTPYLNRYYAKFENAIKIPEKTTEVKIDIYGDQQMHLELYALVDTVTKKDIKIPICSGVDWSGWRTLTVNTGLQMPFEITKIVIKETEKCEEKSAGKLYFDNIAVKNNVVYEGYIPSDITLVKELEDYVISDELAEVFTLHHEMSNEQGDAAVETQSQNVIGADGELFEQLFTYLHIDNKGGYIRTNDGKEQWSELIQQFESSEKPIVVQFSSDNRFYDYLEEALLLDKAAASEQPVLFVFKGDKNALHRKQGVVVVELAPESSLRFTEQFEFEFQ